MDRTALISQKGTPILGFRAAKRTVSEGKASLVVVATNCPPTYVETLEKSGATIERFNGNSRDMGIVYGKPFNISVVAFSDRAK